ncbi:hypothetical protein JXA32_15370 [Candidatus Sumerlaeota bacterium]|nr:hypothetical protein [Candidatus Sumerlaeota bacterium]
MLAKGLIHVFSFLMLSFVVCLVLGLNESDEWRVVAGSVLRRWAKFTLAMVLISVAVILLGGF